LETSILAWGQRATVSVERLDPYPGVDVQAVGEYAENGQSKTVAVAIGPEFGTVGPDARDPRPRRLRPDDRRGAFIIGRRHRRLDLDTDYDGDAFFVSERRSLSSATPYVPGAYGRYQRGGLGDGQLDDQQTVPSAGE
jgi:hypothetical protein